MVAVTVGAHGSRAGDAGRFLPFKAGRRLTAVRVHLDRETALDGKDLEKKGEIRCGIAREAEQGGARAQSSLMQSKMLRQRPFPAVPHEQCAGSHRMRSHPQLRLRRIPRSTALNLRKLGGAAPCVGLHGIDHPIESHPVMLPPGPAAVKPESARERAPVLPPRGAPGTIRLP